VSLSWNPSTGATLYNISRSTTSGGPFMLITSVNAALVIGVTDKHLKNGTTYYYVIAAANAYGTSANSGKFLPHPLRRSQT
jgi:hypothetical protein